MKVGDKVKFRSHALEIKRLLNCDVSTGKAERIFKGEIGKVVNIRRKGHWSATDLEIRFPTIADEVIVPANFFFVLIEKTKGHHLTNMFKPD